MGFFLGERDFASSHEFSYGFDTFFGWGLRRFGERLRLLTSFPTVLTPFWTGIASFGFLWPFLDGDCVVWLLLGRLRLLTSFPTVLTLFWTGIASLGFFGGDTFFDGDCVAKLLFRGERETLRLLMSLPTVLTR